MKRIAKKKTIAKEENVVKKNKENVRYRTNPIIKGGQKANQI